MKKFLYSVLASAMIFSFAPEAKADYYVWDDAKSGLSMSFPDTWKMVSGKHDDDIITIMAPSGRAHAACRMRINTDHRFGIYPPELEWAVQKAEISVEFWDDYLYEYEDHQILQVMDGAGLGRGWGSWAMAHYKGAVQGPYMNRTALMFASYYNDKLYVFECSAHQDAFLDWKNLFMSIAGSIDFKKSRHELLHGNYRPFLDDEKFRFLGDEGDNVVEY